MDIQDKTNEEYQEDLLALQVETVSLTAVPNSSNTKSICPEDMTGETSSKLELAMQGGKMAWWEMDVKTGNVTFSKYKVEMLGYPSENFKHYHDFTALVHPIDRERIMNSMHRHLNGVLDKYEAEYRILANSGEYIWFYDYGSVVKTDSNGAPLICAGFVFNITERKQAEEMFHKSEQMLQTVLDNFPGVVFWKDIKSNYLGCNKSFATGAGLTSPAEIVGKTDFDLPWASTEAKNYRKDDLDVMEGGKGRLHIFETQHQSDGQVIWLDTSKFPLRDSLGQIIGVIGVSNDISMLKMAEQELIIANKELAVQIREKEERADEFIIANKELHYQNEEKEKRAAELIIANKELAFQNREKEKRADELFIANKELHYQNEEKEKRAAELIIANKELAFQNREKEKRADELIIANKELAFQNREKEKRADELIIANKELLYQNEEKEKRAAELIIANKELAFQNEEKEKRAEELIIANKELAFQNREKEKRADELIIANKELLYQNEEKEKRAAELIIANKELAFQNDEKEKRALELMNAKDKAEASDRLKTAFMNNISHEIRTPLNGILGFAPFIIQPDISMEEKKDFLEILNLSGIRLMNTITDYMDISLIISDNMEVHPQQNNISSLLTNVFEDFEEPCLKKNLGIKLQFPDNSNNFILNTDGEILRKAVSKLVDNSVKFTREGSITMGFENKNNEIEIFVKDTGIGIEKDAQERIYEYFMQENVSNTRGHEGSGLGLSIAKGMMQLLGGKIRLESAKNIGTTVFLTHPNIISTATAKPKNSIQAIKVAEMPLILIAEDDDSNYFYINTFLKKDNKTLRAFNGQEAVDLCKMHPDINLVLMDIKMPVMNGIAATHIIKSFRNDLPIIAVTANAQSGDEFKIKEAGCDDYLSKPINSTKLLSLIQKYIKK